MFIRSLFEQLSTTAGSLAIRESLLLYPIIETTHVLSMGLFLGMIITLDLRLIGLTFKNIPIQEIAKQFLPWALFGFALMTITGALLVYSDPLKAYDNIFFKIKIAFIGLAGLNAGLFHFCQQINNWSQDSFHKRFAGILSLLLWILVLSCGRLMAYNWFDQSN